MTRTTHRERRTAADSFRGLTASAPALLLALALTGCDGLVEGTDAVTTDVPAATSLPSLYDRYLYKCANCHAPGAPGRTDATEGTLDFTSVATARASLAGTASGMSGNQESCNGVPFLGATYDASLLAAVLDFDVRAAFAAGDSCDADAISDMTLRSGTPPAGFPDDLRTWIDGGAR